MKKPISSLIRKFLISNGAGKVTSLIFGVLVLCFAIGFYIFAWTEPSANPPQGNVDIPLNVSGDPQTKTGDLTLPRLKLNATGAEGNIESVNMIQGNDDLLIYSNSLKNLPIYLEGNPVIINNDASTGNVGIGTAGPNSKLEILSTNTGTGTQDGIDLRLYNNQSVDSATGGKPTGIGFAHVDSNTGWYRMMAAIKSEPTSVSNLYGVKSNLTFYNYDIQGGSGLLKERMRIDLNGNVGIGTAGPGYKLDVQGGQVNASGGLCIAGDCKTNWGSVTGLQGGGTVNYLSKFTDSGTLGNSQIFDNGTNVGIGTTSPVEKLTLGDGGVIRTTRNAAGWIIKDARTDDTQPRGLYSGDGFSLLQLMTANTARMTIDGSGNVGIGTTGPQKKLHIQGVAAGTDSAINNDSNDRPGLAIRGYYPEIDLMSNIYNAGGNTNHGPTLRFVSYDSASSWRHWVIGIAGTSATNLDFGYAVNQSNPHFGIADYDRAWGGSSGFTFMRITSAGNVGIGTTGPGYKLDVQGGQINASGGLCIAGVCKTGWDTITNYWTLSGSNIYNNNSGNVGIGATPGGYKLDVSGNIRATGTVYANANGAAYLCGGDDACLNDVNVANTVGVYGVQNSAVGGIQFGSGGGTISGSGGIINVSSTFRVGGSVDCIGGYCPPNNAIRLTPNLHLNSNAGYAVILNWDNGTTGATQTLRVGNGAGSDAFYVRADGYVWASQYGWLHDYFARVGGSNASGTWPISITGNATTADKVNGYGSSPDNSHPGTGLRPFYSWNIGQAYNATAGYSNGISVGSHPGDQAYGFQIVQNMWDDRLYFRRYNAGWQGWLTVIDSATIGSQSVNYAASAGNADMTDSQHLGTGNSPTFTNIYNNGWFRNNNNLEGLYNQAVGAHFYASAANIWNMGGGGTYPQLIFRDTHQSTIRGYVYSDSSGFGLLHSSGGWAIRTAPGSDTIYMPGNVGIGTTSPNAKLDVGAGAVKMGNGYAVGTRQGGNYLIQSGTFACNPTNYYASGDAGYWCATGDQAFSPTYLITPHVVTSSYQVPVAYGYGVNCTAYDVTTLNFNGFIDSHWSDRGQSYCAWLAYGQTTATDFDLAESYRTDDTTIESGDVACVDPNNNSHIIKCQNPYDPTAIGIVSTEPGLIIGDRGEADERLVGLQGRAPVKVTLENGPIERGDLLTPSGARPGYAMKATKAGQIIGKALQPFNGKSTVLGKNAFDGLSEAKINKLLKQVEETGEGQTMAFINISWYDPDVYLTSTGEVNIGEDGNGNYLIKRTDGSLITRIGAFAELAVAKIKSGIVETKKLVVDGIDILKKLNELSEKVESQEKKIEELNQELQKIREERN